MSFDAYLNISTYEWLEVQDDDAIIYNYLNSSIQLANSNIAFITNF